MDSQKYTSSEQSAHKANNTTKSCRIVDFFILALLVIIIGVLAFILPKTLSLTYSLEEQIEIVDKHFSGSGTVDASNSNRNRDRVGDKSDLGWTERPNTWKVKHSEQYSQIEDYDLDDEIEVEVPDLEGVVDVGDLMKAESTESGSEKSLKIDLKTELKTDLTEKSILLKLVEDFNSLRLELDRSTETTRKLTAKIDQIQSKQKTDESQVPSSYRNPKPIAYDDSKLYARFTKFQAKINQKIDTFEKKIGDKLDSRIGHRIDQELSEKFGQKLTNKLDNRLEKKLDLKFQEKFDQNLAVKLGLKLDKKLDTKLGKLAENLDEKLSENLELKLTNYACSSGFSKTDEQTCTPNTCICQNGTPSKTCPINGIQHCETCENGYQIEIFDAFTDVCRPNVCQCENGLANGAVDWLGTGGREAGTKSDKICKKQGISDCGICDEGYELKKFVIEKSKSDNFKFDGGFETDFTNETYTCRKIPKPSSSKWRGYINLTKSSPNGKKVEELKPKDLRAMRLKSPVSSFWHKSKGGTTVIYSTKFDSNALLSDGAVAYIQVQNITKLDDAIGLGLCQNPNKMNYKELYKPRLMYSGSGGLRYYTKYREDVLSG